MVKQTTRQSNTAHPSMYIYMYIFMFNSENQSENVCLLFSSPRVMGSLLSAYLLTQSPPHSSPFPHSPVLPRDDPISERLLELAHDLAIRLLPAFENTATGIPHPRVRAHMYTCTSWRLHNSPLPPSLPPPPHPLPPFTLHSSPQVNLCRGVPADGSTETCTSGAGTLSVEFTLLSRLLGDPTYERLARRAVRALWDRRHPGTGLVGEHGSAHFSLLMPTLSLLSLPLLTPSPLSLSSLPLLSPSPLSLSSLPLLSPSPLSLSSLTLPLLSPSPLSFPLLSPSPLSLSSLPLLFLSLSSLPLLFPSPPPHFSHSPRQCDQHPLGSVDRQDEWSGGRHRLILRVPTKGDQ